MKALTLHAPYAVAVAAGEKRREYRTWPTNYRGDLLICSAALCPPEWQGLLPIGVALAIISLKDCKKIKDGYSWALADARPIKPFAVKGKQRIFEHECSPEFVNIYGDDLLDYWHSLGLINQIAD